MSRKSLYALHWVGYGFLLLALFDIIQSLVPPDITNPLWEMSTMSSVVERTPIPILGFILVFWGEDEDRKLWEEKILKILRSVCIILSIIFFLMLPLIMLNTLRIDQANSMKIEQTLQQESQQIAQLEKQINQGNLPQLKVIATQLKSLGMEVNIDQAEPQLKAEVLAQISKAKNQMPDRASTLKNNQRFGVLKQALKLFLGALVGSTLYYQIWRSVSWVKEF